MKANWQRVLNALNGHNDAYLYRRSPKRWEVTTTVSSCVWYEVYAAVRDSTVTEMLAAGKVAPRRIDGMIVLTLPDRGQAITVEM